MSIFVSVLGGGLRVEVAHVGSGHIACLRPKPRGSVPPSAGGESRLKQNYRNESGLATECTIHKNTNSKTKPCELAVALALAHLLFEVN